MGVVMKPFSEPLIDQLFGLMKSCITPNFYGVLDEDRGFYESVARNGLGLCVVNEQDELVASLLCRRNVAELYNYRGTSDIIDKCLSSDVADHGMDFMNCCVRADYRGRHLQNKLIAKNINRLTEMDNSMWCWCQIHKDNLAGAKSVLLCGFKPVLEDVTLDAGHVHRDIYIKL